MRKAQGWMLALTVLGASVSVAAEEVELTTYYPSPRGVYEELRWGTRGALQADQGASIELWGGGKTPYIDFCNTAGCPEDFDMRLILSGNNALSIDGGDVAIGKFTPAAGFMLDVNGPVQGVNEFSSIGGVAGYSFASRGGGGNAERWVLYAPNDTKAALWTNGANRIVFKENASILMNSDWNRLDSKGRLHIQTGGGEPLYLNPWANTVIVGGGGGPGTLQLTGNINFIGGGSTISRGGRLHIQANEFLYLNPWAGASTVYVGGGGGPGNLHAVGNISAAGNISTRATVAGGNVTAGGQNVCRADGTHCATCKCSCP